MFSPIHFHVLSVDEKITNNSKSDILHVYLAVSWNSYFIANFLVCMNRKTNQPVESRNSLLAMFTQIRRGFKKLSTDYGN